MNRKELEELKMKVYVLYGKNRSKKSNELYKEILRLIRYTEDLKHTFRQLNEIGGKHHL